MLRQTTACLVLIWGLLAAPVSTAVAETPSLRSPVLVIDSDALYRDSVFGQRVQADITAESRELAAENRRIEEALEAEELSLTEQRQSLSPEDFRTLADAFDEKVRGARQAQDAKARQLARRQEEARREFLAAAAPVLEAMMREAGAVVVLERRTIFVSLNAIDITRDAIARIDAEVGDGTNGATSD